MRDESPPWVDAVEDSTGPTVDPFVLAGTTIWLVVFGWYVLLEATPRADLARSTAALAYSAATLLAGVCFGWGEDTVSNPIRRVADPPGLRLGASAVVIATLSWFVLAAPANPYQAGLWMGAIFLGAGIAIGAAGR